MDESQKLFPATSGFVLSAAVTVLFNTALAWAKDIYPGLNDAMKSVAGHHWTTHGVVDLVLFVGLGLIFTSARTGEKIDPNRLVVTLTGAVVIAAVGLGLWFAFV
jgi:hypothetical protein